MAQITEPATDTWTAADLVQRFGAVPLRRVRPDPPPGSASESDVVEIHDREDRLYELVDGVLLEKAVGTYESYLAGLLGGAGDAGLCSGLCRRLPVLAPVKKLAVSGPRVGGRSPNPLPR